MDVRLLEYLLKIEEYGNISKAAEEIHISQSALNQNLAKIEASMKTSLFYRKDKRLVPTGAGEIYLANARKMIEVQQQTMESIANLMKNRDRTPRFGMIPYFSATFGKRFFSLLKRRYPDIIFEMTEMDCLICEEALESQVIDAGIHWNMMKNHDLAQTLNGAKRLMEQGYGTSFLPARMVHIYAGYQIYEVPELPPCDVYFSYREEHPREAMLQEVLGIFQGCID